MLTESFGSAEPELQPDGQSAALHTAFDLPVMLLHDEAIRANIRTMADFCSQAGVSLAPHAKTSLTPYIVQLQMDAGAWAQTAATIAHVKRLAGMGIRRILLANVLVDVIGIEWVAEHLLSAASNGEFLCYVDSMEGVDILERTLSRQRGRKRMGILVELGFAGGRTGARNLDEAMRLARRVAGSEVLDFRGLAGFEGLMPRAGGGLPEGIREFLSIIRDATDKCWAESLFESTPIVTAGGSSYFDIVVEELGASRFDFEVRTVLRSGCYVTHDHGMYRDSSPFDGRAGSGNRFRLRPALELIATVWSRPEPDLVIAGFGRRDVPTDERMPVVLGTLDQAGQEHQVDAQVTGVNDQHAFVRVPTESRLGPGDVLSVGISHPCGAFDRWRQLLLVDRRRRVISAVAPQL